MRTLSSPSSGGSNSFLFSMVFCVFLALKLLGKITWSWWWVCAPLWIPAIVGVVIIAVVFLVLRKK